MHANNCGDNDFHDIYLLLCLKTVDRVIKRGYWYITDVKPGCALAKCFVSFPESVKDGEVICELSVTVSPWYKEL